VERIVEYLDLPQEPPAIIESNRPPAYWPSSSKNDSLVTVENLVVKYAPELLSVLQDVSFLLKAGERIGLLGRTGSGKGYSALELCFCKSTLLLAARNGKSEKKIMYIA
jgi:ABC-type multidrug transport system fused ATPase/permease subunit